MQHDDVIWSVINGTHCSYRIMTKTHMFCRNQYNLTGFCSRGCCPLANSQYATVREEKGICYLFVKVVERAAFPDKMWEKIKLSHNVAKAIQQINEHLIYWPNFIRNKCKQRYLRIQQYLMRIRKLTLNSKKMIIPISTKAERREKNRERKALIAARLDVAIEKNLAKRLHGKDTSAIVNYPERAFEHVMEEEEDIEKTIASEEEEYEDEEDVGRIQYVVANDIEESSDEDIEDITDKMEAHSSVVKKSSKQGKHKRGSILYDDEETEAIRGMTEAQREAIIR